MALQGKRIIVTGCARGMGEASLNNYVRAGAHVIGMDDTGQLIPVDGGQTSVR